MSDFNFARKSSNLIQFCPAKVRKPTEHQQMTLNPLAVKGTFTEKTALYAHGRVQICGFAHFGLSLGVRNIYLSVLLARLRVKFDCSGGHQWHQLTCKEGFVVCIT